MPSSSSSSKETTTKISLEPLQQLLSDVLTRLEVLESKAGIVVVGAAAAAGSSSGAGTTNSNTPGSALLLLSASSGVSSRNVALKSGGGEELAVVKGYDLFLLNAVAPFGAACDSIDQMPSEVSKHFIAIMETLRFIIVLASRSKKPNTGTTTIAVALADHLKPVHAAVHKFNTIIQKILPRDLDRHGKALQEVVSTISWVVAPHAPAAMIKETMSSTEFWTNRIRKDYKDNPIQLAFCDKLKTMLVELVKYVEEFHTMGLAFTGQVMSLEEAAIRLTDEETTLLTTTAAAGTSAAGATDGTGTTTVATDTGGFVVKSPVGGSKKNPILGNVVASSNIVGLMGELTLRQTADGSSAATGLKHVTKDQQTWRKEYTAAKSSSSAAAAAESNADVTTTTTAASTKKTVPKKKPRGLPICEYQDRGFKWLVENQTADSSNNSGNNSGGGTITVEISDAKQQVYIFNCENVTVHIVGKFKSLVIDNCQEVAVVFDTLISSTEIVNCKKIQLQVTGVCPVFTIDKTINIVIYLSEASKSISSFCTSLSSEMNVSFPVTGSDELKELPIPEQFVHTISATDAVTSDVSELYR